MTKQKRDHYQGPDFKYIGSFQKGDRFKVVCPECNRVWFAKEPGPYECAGCNRTVPPWSVVEIDCDDVKHSKWLKKKIRRLQKRANQLCWLASYMPWLVPAPPLPGHGHTEWLP